MNPECDTISERVRRRRSRQRTLGSPRTPRNPSAGTRAWRELFSQGWTVIPPSPTPGHRPTAEHRSRARYTASSTGLAIFGDPVHRRRTQARLGPQHPRLCALVHAVLERALRELGVADSHAFFEPVVLASAAGCPAQPPHLDYDPDLLEGVAPEDLPLGAILALEGGTKLDVYGLYQARGKRLQAAIPEGAVLVFRGDLVHAGSAYDKPNVRVHAFLDSSVGACPRNMTFLVTGEGRVRGRPDPGAPTRV